MKHYLFTIMTRDGDHEYFDKWLFAPTGDMTELDVLAEYTGIEHHEWSEVHERVYENSYDYRHYSVYSRQEVKPENVEILSHYI